MPSVKLGITCSAVKDVKAGMVLNTDSTWSEQETKNGEPVSKIFKTQEGKWTYISEGDFTRLNNNDGMQVGTLNGLNPAAPGSSGSGYGSENSRDIWWTKT
ncbi:hypothetical protein ABIF69_005906 [Bradyrhizobium japonicum]